MQLRLIVRFAALAIAAGSPAAIVWADGIVGIPSAGPQLCGFYGADENGELVDTSSPTVLSHTSNSANDEVTLFAPQSTAAGCGCEVASCCEEDRPFGYFALVGYEAFRGIPDGSWENNGLHTGANFGTRLGELSDWTGIGAQIGGTVGIYNWSGTGYRMDHQNIAETQGFLTYGLFRKANENSPWSASLVHDWMFNHNFSVMAEDPTLSQLRGQVGYAVSDWNEIGLWGACRTGSDSRQVPAFGRVTWQAINQLNVYWHYKWGIGQPDTWLWVGVPERDRLAGNNSLGDYLAGALANCPFSERVSLYALVTYMHPSASAGPAGSLEEAWSFAIGLSLYPGRDARSKTVKGRGWLPQLPVATNGYFLVDASDTY